MTNVISKETVNISPLSETVQDYLSLIYVMERDNEAVIGAHLADLLGVKPPTVTNTLKRMVRDSLITMDQNGTHLTEEGWAASKVVMRRHMLMEWMMVNTLPWSKLHAEAHHLEHAISPQTETALLEKLGYPKTCPHGNPLPGFEYAVANWIPLTEIQQEESFIVRRVHELAEENNAFLTYLETNQVFPDSQAKVIEILPFNQTITIEIMGKSVTFGYAAARYIFVEPV